MRWFAPALALTVFLFALLVWRYRPKLFKRFVVAMLWVLYLGLLISLVLPTVPPWPALANGALPELDRIVELTLFELNGNTQAAYENVSPNDVAAMLSLHMALTVLILASVWRARGKRGELMRAIEVLYVAAMGFALVYGGEHCVVDLAFGALAAVVVWRATRRLERPAQAIVQLSPVQLKPADRLAA